MEARTRLRKFLSVTHSVRVLRQENKGVARTRNELCSRAGGDLIAFLDADDIWHPEYLSVQSTRFREHPQAVALFTGQVLFHGHDDYTWDSRDALGSYTSEVVGPIEFFVRLCTTGRYGSAFCCVPKEIVTQAGPEPFSSTLGSAEDFYMFSSLCLLNRIIVRTPAQLVAYRRTPGSLSANRLKISGDSLEAFRLLESRFHKQAWPDLVEEFDRRFASARRTYSRCLMATGRVLEAREQLRGSLANSHDPASRARALALLLLTYMPSRAQPRWLSQTP
jgi:glycosyltransferase involved in cell wall biosynthesis